MTLIVNLKVLMERKAAIEQRKITCKIIEEETGIRALTLTRLATDYDYKFSRKEIEKLLIYFSCQPLD